ncbi:MAG: hypothetical protein DRH24_14130 [Deltaproteobacteria bacterium]|nr:MAG: hypothetical protein DRH24_14130 [Deltaproteobacteria bacterium]
MIRPRVGERSAAPPLGRAARPPPPRARARPRPVSERAAPPRPSPTLPGGPIPPTPTRVGRGSAAPRRRTEKERTPYRHCKYGVRAVHVRRRGPKFLFDENDISMTRPLTIQ